MDESERARRAQSARAAWARRRRNGTAKPKEMSPEAKAAKAARLRAVLSDPEIEARRVKRLAERLAEVKKTPEYRRKVSEGVRRAYLEKPGFAEQAIARIRNFSMSADNRDKVIAAMREASRRPEVREAARQRYHDPKYAIPRELGRQRALEKRRGFKIPAHLWPAYKKLTQIHKLSIREAGLHLGLIKP